MSFNHRPYHFRHYLRERIQRLKDKKIRFQEKWQVLDQELLLLDALYNHLEDFNKEESNEIKTDE